jgi:hypothetical protein
MPPGYAKLSNVDTITKKVRPFHHNFALVDLDAHPAPDTLFQTAPSKVLDLIAAVVGEAMPGSAHALGKAPAGRLRLLTRPSSTGLPPL